MRKTFIFGVGAQKSGTSWLSRYLRDREDADFGFTKEYHIWNATHIDDFQSKKITVTQAILAWKKFIRYRMQRSPEFYFGYFSQKLRAEGKRLTGDITPAYAVLHPRTYSFIDSEFRKRDIETKFIFIMRDPVERCRSAFGRRLKTIANRDNCEIDEIFRSFCSERHAFIRTKYNATVENLRSSVDQSQIYVGIYEDLFSDEGVRRLSNFIGIEPNTAFLSNKINAAKKKAAISSETRAMVANQFREVYEWCEIQYPKTRELWSGYQYL